MTRIFLDEALRQKLRELKEPLELCDESGRVLAHVTPVEDLSHLEPWVPPLDCEDLVRRAATEKRYSTAEVLSHLEALANP